MEITVAQADKSQVVQAMFGSVADALLPFVHFASDNPEPPHWGEPNTGKRQRGITFRFANNHGASVVCNRWCYGWEDGLIEIAVLDKDLEIDYTTPVTNDVIGWLTPAKAFEILLAIQSLPKD